MNTAQRTRVYFPAWNVCAETLGWVMRHGRLVADLDGQADESWPDPAGSERRRIIADARKLAAREHRAVTAADLRHACNWIASGGKTLHTETMTNHATTMAVRLFTLLADPWNLDAVNVWLHPEEADRSDFVEYLRRQAPEATLVAIARNAWDTTDWSSRSLEELRWLGRQVTNRHRPIYDPCNAPF